MDILNNREIAIALWLSAILIYIYSAEKMIPVRGALKNLISACKSRPLVIVFFSAVAYTSATVYILSELELWNLDQLKNTIFWFFSAGLLPIFNLEKTKNDKHLFKNSIIQNLRLLAILQFVVGVYTFPLLAELLIVPLTTVIVLMASIAETDQKYLPARKLLNGIIIAFGLFTLAYTIYMLTTDLKELTQEKTLYDFIVPTLLTIMYLPFVFAVIVYTTYETTFVRLQFIIQDKRIRFWAKLYAIIFINFRFSTVERWANHISKIEVNSHKQLLDTFTHLRKLKKLEKSKSNVSKSQGWSPYLAKNFLLSEGLFTGNYDLLYDDHWFASSNIYEIGSELFCDNIAYYIEGIEGIAKTLKIKLNVNGLSRTEQSNEKLLVLSGVLIKESLGIEMSDAVTNALRTGTPYEEHYDNKTIFVRKENWEGHKHRGYDLKMEIVTS